MEFLVEMAEQSLLLLVLTMDMRASVAKIFKWLFLELQVILKQGEIIFDVAEDIKWIAAIWYYEICVERRKSLGRLVTI